MNKSPNGKKVKTLVAIAKSLGYSASVGALQANFGTPQETGIIDLQNQITDLNNQIALDSQTLVDLNNQLADLSTQIESPDLTEEEVADLQAQIDTVQTEISNLEADIANATTDLANTETELQETVESVNIGNRDSSWTSINLDTNNDGILDVNDIL